MFSLAKQKKTLISTLLESIHNSIKIMKTSKVLIFNSKFSPFFVHLFVDVSELKGFKEKKMSKKLFEKLNQFKINFLN